MFDYAEAENVIRNTIIEEIYQSMISKGTSPDNIRNMLRTAFEAGHCWCLESADNSDPPDDDESSAFSEDYLPIMVADPELNEDWDD